MIDSLQPMRIFVSVVQNGSLSSAARQLGLSPASVSRHISALEEGLGCRLVNRTSRKLTLTEAGEVYYAKVGEILQQIAEANDSVAELTSKPRGTLRVHSRVLVGHLHVVPVLPEFLARYPEVSVDLHLSDASVDLIGEGFDMAVRIARLPDSSLIARRLFTMPRYTVAAPSYLKRWGRPTHPMHLAEHKCFGYAYLSTPGIWHYTNASGEQASVRPAGQLRVNNGEALLPSVIAGLGIADLPDFIVGDAIASGEVEVILKGWKQPEGAVHLVTPPGGPRPARVEVLAEFLMKQFAKGKKK